MITSNTSTTPRAGDVLCTTTDEGEFRLEQAIERSQPYANTYREQHISERLALDESRTAVMAAGRLEWLLQEYRPSISGLFTTDDWRQLLSCYQGDIFHPDQFHQIASGLCNDLGIELDSYEKSGISSLVDKLHALSAAQRLTLADVLEQIWHRAFRQNHAFEDFLAELGIELAD